MTLLQGVCYKVIESECLSTSFGIEPKSEANSNHPDSFSVAETTGLRQNSVSIFFDILSTDIGNLKIKLSHI